MMVMVDECGFPRIMLIGINNQIGVIVGTITKTITKLLKTKNCKRQHILP